MQRNPKHKTGQGLVDYALILALIAVVVIVGAAALGGEIQDVFRRITLFGDDGASFLSVKDDFLSRIQAFYDANGQWPRSWGDYAFTDIGLDPDDWDEAVDGIYWNPRGAALGLANRSGDNLQIYVNDLDGNTRHLYDGWNIWCPVGDEHCYYHTIAPGNEVDISTLTVVEE
jgi:Flp pilus assembly pilin Flp